jgi:hypothetical protein
MTQHNGTLDIARKPYVVIGGVCKSTGETFTGYKVSIGWCVDGTKWEKQYFYNGYESKSLAALVKELTTDWHEDFLTTAEHISEVRYEVTYEELNAGVRKRLKQALAQVPEDYVDVAVGVLTDWIREHDYALCIFNPEEVASCSLRGKDIESAMMEEGNFTIRNNGGAVGEELEEEEA